MTSVSIGILLALAAALAALCLGQARRIRRLRARLDRRRRREGAEPPERWPVPLVELADFDAAFGADAFGCVRAGEVRFVAAGPRGVPGGTSDLEAWVLCVLAKESRRIFEIGTCTGRTTYLLARNSPADARVASLTLAPEQASEYAHEGGDDEDAHRQALKESRYTSFYYSGTPAEAKIEQLYGDSKRFDEEPFAERCDLVFVDGSHAYSYVRSDSEKALRMLRPGGIALWHDYRGPGVDETLGVYRALNELAEKLDLVHLAGTSLVAYRRPAPPGAGR